MPPLPAPPAPLSPASRDVHSPTSLWTRAQLELASWKRGTVSIHDVDPWLQFNVYIRRGFRHRLLRKREALGSLFLYVHNESFNVLSHLVAALLMLSLLWWPPRVLMGDGGSGGEAVSATAAAFGVMSDLYERSSGGGGVSWATPEAERLWFAANDPSFSSSPGKQRGRDGSGARRGGEPPAPSSGQIPSWLRGLHGLEPTGSATAAAAKKQKQEHVVKAASRGEEWDTKEEESRGYVPPGGATSPRDMFTAPADEPSSSSAATAYLTSWASFLRFLVLLPFSPFISTTTTADALPADVEPLSTQVPLSIAARLRFSLRPLTCCLLLTFLLSCVYHTFMPCCRSRRGYQQLLQCDVVGVLLSIGGSAYTYLTCGMPCASENALLSATTLVTVSTLLCLYCVVLAPMWGVLTDGWRWIWALTQGVVAWVLCAVIEFVTGAPLPPAEFDVAPSSSSVSRSASQQQQRQQRQQPPLHARATGRQGQIQRGQTRLPKMRREQPPSASYRVILSWLHRYRHVAAAPTCPFQHEAADVCTAHRHTEKAATPREPVHITAHQRAAVVGVYCLLHLGIYRWFVYPKSSPAYGGFTQGVYYHNATYVFLFIGGIVNAARFPERVVFHWTRKAAQHTRALAAEEAAAWCAEELTRDVKRPPSASPPLPASHVHSWWYRFSFPKWMVTYVVSASTLDYVGNSHNLWHICTMLSAFSNVLAVYYDCIEYDLVVCP